MQRKARQRIEDREKRHKVKAGVWVRLVDGSHLCKVRGCPESPVDEEPLHRGLCHKHFAKTPDGRTKCKQCRARWCVAPEVDGLCEYCHPEYKELLAFEAHVLESLRRGENPTTALQQVTDLTPQEASREVQKVKQRKSAAARIRRVMREQGLDLETIMAKVRANIDATKRIYDKEGGLIDETPDYRASNQALDLALKAGGYYPGKERPQARTDDRPQTAVVVLPAPQPIEPDRPIYTLPIKDTVADDPEDV